MNTTNKIKEERSRKKGKERRKQNKIAINKKVKERKRRQLIKTRKKKIKSRKKGK